MNNILRLIKVHFINTFKLNGKKANAKSNENKVLGLLGVGCLIFAIIALYG